MTITLQGQHLIFLISQPRSGSTMTQRILGSHPLIQTAEEPWILLHPLYPMRHRGYEAEYRAELANRGLKSFIALLPNREEDYYEGMRRMYAYLYQQALPEGKQFFLDKTPRYYYIIPELARLFPEAKFIILLRNPLSVLLSSTNLKKGSWYRIYRYKADLLDAPSLLVDSLANLGKQALQVNYEQLALSPETEFERLCDWLGIPFVPEMIEYGRVEWEKWGLGDHVSVHKHQRPSTESLDKWKGALDDPQFWRASQDYLEALGSDLLARMGYDYAELTQTLAEHQPRSLRSTASLHKILTARERFFWLERLLESLRAHGVSVTLRTILRNRRI